jgi:CBS-domain-containing membrane protein
MMPIGWKLLWAFVAADGYRRPEDVLGNGVVDGRDGGRFFGGDADVDVRDVMTVGASVVTASPDTTLKEVAELMLEHGISGLPVVDEERRVLGVVTEADIIRGETAGTGTQGMIARARALGDTAAVAIPRTAGEAMSAPASRLARTSQLRAQLT